MGEFGTTTISGCFSPSPTFYCIGGRVIEGLSVDKGAAQKQERQEGRKVGAWLEHGWGALQYVCVCVRVCVCVCVGVRVAGMGCQK